MRTTLTLDADVAELLRAAMAERGVPLKVIVNDALRLGLRRPGAAARFRTPTYRMGRSAASLDKALQLAGALEDEVLARRLAERR